MDDDRSRWNAIWRERAGELEAPSAFLVDHAHVLPSHGRALDVAGGGGRHAVWLARHGFDVTMIDISDVAIVRAERRATDAGLAKKIRFLQADLETAELPAPVFDVVLVADYLDRGRRDELAGLVFEGGLVIAMQATVKNLERHDKPSRKYLVEEGELGGWLRSLDFEILIEREDWTGTGRHEAAVIARRARSSPPPAPDEPPPPAGPYR